MQIHEKDPGYIDWLKTGKFITPDGYEVVSYDMPEIRSNQVFLCGRNTHEDHKIVSYKVDSMMTHPRVILSRMNNAIKASVEAYRREKDPHLQETPGVCEPIVL